MRMTHKSIIALLALLCVIAVFFLANPEAHATQDQQLEEAVQHIQNSQWGPAWTILSSLSKTMSQNPRFLVVYGRYFMRRGDYAQALLQFEKAAKYDPNLIQARSYLTSRDDLHGAQQLPLAEVIDGALKRNPNDLTALFLEAWLLSAMQEYGEAIQTYERILELSPDDKDAVEGLAKSYELKRQYGTAAEYYLYLLELEPNNVQTMLSLAAMYQKDAQFNKATQVYRQAQKLDPDNEEIKAQLGLAKNATIDLDDRIREINRRILWNNKDISSYLTLAKTYMRQENLEKAKQAYRKGLESNPDDPALLYSLGEAYEMEGDWYKAREYYNETLKRDPDHVDAELGLEDLKLTYRPRLTMSYNFNRSARYDSWLGFTRTISRDDVGTFKYTQPIRPWLELSTAYSYTLMREIDRILDFRQYMMDRHNPHFEAMFTLPYDISIIASYDLYIYANRNQSVYTLQNTEFRHGAFFSFQKYIWHNNLGFQYVRDFYNDTFTGELLIEATNMYTISDNIDFHEYVTLLVSMGIADRSNASTSMEYRFRPRFRMPFYDNIYVEYEFQFADHPNRYTHSGALGIQEEITDWFMFDIAYTPAYYTLVSKMSQAGTFSLIFTPSDRTQLTIDGNINYFDNDIGQYYVASFRIIL